MSNSISQLTALARRIKSREETIEALRARTLQGVYQSLAEVVLQGEDLIKVKALCPHGNWLPWLRVNCPKLSERRAQRYMALARKAPRAADLSEADSLRSALALCDMEGDSSGPQQPKRWPPFMEAIGRLSKLVGFVNRFPITQWPSDGLDKFRDELKPVASLLWPERFKDATPQNQ